MRGSGVTPQDLAQWPAGDFCSAASQALAAARLEEELQADACGHVEGGHDVDAADLRTRAAGAVVYLRAVTADGAVASGRVDAVRRDVAAAMRTLDGLGLG